MRKRSVKSKRDYNPENKTSLVWTMCSTPGCGREQQIDSTSSGLICSSCTMRKCLGLMSESEINRLFSVGQNKSKSPFPRGWKWMKEFVDARGNVYHKGVEQPDLKGTLQATDVAAIKAKQKLNKEKRAVAENKKLLKMAAEKKEMKKAIDKQKDFLNHKK